MIKTYTRAFLHRIIRPALWNWSGNARAAQLTHESFRGLFPFRRNAAEFLNDFHEAARFRFFFHPRNQKDFFLQLITQSQSYEEILRDAQDVGEHQIDVLGSGRTFLGEKINWRKDFKSGKEWPLRRLTAGEIIDAGNPSDIKLVWELNRFHQVWWLGKAYWVTHNEEYALKFRSLIEAWIDENPVGQGPNWFGAMEVSIRACNWIAGYYFFCESKSLPDEFWTRFLKSLYAHGLFIETHLEYSKRNGNHLLSDIVGLIVLGVFFRSASFGQNWLAWSKDALVEEMEHQIYSDGVDYEKSVGYHRFVLELIYTAAVLCEKNRVSLPEQFMSRLERMFEFTLAYTRPDGSVPLVGDADDGRLFRFSAREDFNDHRHALSVGSILFHRPDFRAVAGSFSQDALWLFGAEGFEKHQMLKPEPAPVLSRAFSEGGFYVMRSQDVHLFVDAGDLGMRGRGGHGHNDTLSFELWCDGGPLVVDSGTFVYTADIPVRNEFRSTPAHNTLAVDGTELADFRTLWAITADETHPRVLNWSTGPARDVLEAEHYAYLRLPSRITHRRRFELQKAGFSLSITDTLSGSGTHSVESYLHFAPEIVLEISSSQKAIARKGNAEYIISVSAGELSVLETWFSKSYGVREKNKTLKIALATMLPSEIRIQIDRAQSL
jgi:uncharacterized heparinase superfamily protein